MCGVDPCVEWTEWTRVWSGPMCGVDGVDPCVEWTEWTHVWSGWSGPMWGVDGVDQEVEWTEWTSVWSGLKKTHTSIVVTHTSAVLYYHGQFDYLPPQCRPCLLRLEPCTVIVLDHLTSKREGGKGIQ